jgi:phosphatidylglycerophosphate synthase
MMKFVTASGSTLQERAPMFDGKLRPWIDWPLDAAGAALAQRAVNADHVSIAGFMLGLGAAGAVIPGWFGGALILLAANRIADGLDGAVARATALTDRGGFLDITLDFAFYAAFPLAFAVHSPAANALAAATLLAAFLVNGAAFLAYAVIAAKRGQTTAAQGQKSIYYLAGLAEGAETIAVFVAWCLWPGYFPAVAYGFAALCAISAAARLAMGWQLGAPRSPVV